MSLRKSFVRAPREQEIRVFAAPFELAGARHRVDGPVPRAAVGVGSHRENRRSALRMRRLVPADRERHRDDGAGGEDQPWHACELSHATTIASRHAFQLMPDAGRARQTVQ